MSAGIQREQWASRAAWAPAGHTGAPNRHLVTVEPSGPQPPWAMASGVSSRGVLLDDAIDGPTVDSDPHRPVTGHVTRGAVLRAHTAPE
jgi:hypothetical protein